MEVDDYIIIMTVYFLVYICILRRILKIRSGVSNTTLA